MKTFRMSDKLIEKIRTTEKGFEEDAMAQRVKTLRKAKGIHVEDDSVTCTLLIRLDEDRPDSIVVLTTFLEIIERYPDLFVEIREGEEK